MVMGASVGAKFVMAWGTPSSRILKLSFFSPGMMSPFVVVAITSRVTTGTSTEMVTQASGGGCCLLGTCFGLGVGLACGGALVYGPSGACAGVVEQSRNAAATVTKSLPTFEANPLIIRISPDSPPPLDAPGRSCVVSRKRTPQEYSEGNHSR